MRSLGWLSVAALVVGCGAPSLPPLPPAEATLTPLAPPPKPPAPRTDADRANDFARGWALWTDAKRDEATALFTRLVHELSDLPPKAKTAQPTAGLPSAPLAVASDGSRGVALSNEGAYWFDGAGVPLRYDVAEASSVSFLPRSPLAVLSGTGLAIFDGTTFGRVLRAPDVTGWHASESGKLIAYVEAAPDEAQRLHVWDVATRTERRVLTLRDGESADAASVGFSPDEKEMYARVANSDGAYTMAIFDASGVRMDFPAPWDASPPSYSADGKYVAYAHNVVSDKGRGGRTLLVDRTTRKPVTTSNALTYPTATRFSKNGKLLIVGDLRRLSVLEVPSLRVVATTPFIRPQGGIDDDLQNIVDIEVLGADLGFWALTADSTNAVFRLPSATLVWKGRGERTMDAGGVQSFNDRAEKNQLVTIDAKLAVTQRALTQAEIDAPYPTLDDPAAEKMRTRLESTVCTVRERVFPIAACR